MKRLIAVAVVIAVSLIVVGVASAQIRTTIDHRGTDFTNPSDAMVFGVLDTPKAKCRSGRTLKLLVPHVPGKGGGFELVDTDRSSHAGTWAFRANLLGVSSARIRVGEKKLGHGNGTCAAATRTIAFI
jgi:hypothetical protein